MKKQVGTQIIILALALTACKGGGGFQSTDNPQDAAPIAPVITPVVQFAISSQTVSESVGNVNLIVQQSVTSLSPTVVSVQYSGTAVVDNDYTQSAVSVTIPAGQLQTQLTIPILADNLYEIASDTLQIQLIQPVNNQITIGSRNLHTLTIQNADARPTASFAAASQNVTEGNTSAVIAVTLDRMSEQNVTVPFNLAGTAVGSGADYTISGSSIVIPAGQLSANISVNVTNNDTDDDVVKTIVANLQAPTNADLGAGTSHTSTIIDNDVEMILAQGHFGRTVVSCDQGQTWIHNQSNSGSVRCNTAPENYDCFHAGDSGQGAIYQDRGFFVGWGWGAFGALIERTTDGLNFTTKRQFPVGSNGLTGLAFGNNTLMAAYRHPKVSLDFGDTWTENIFGGLSSFHARAIGYAPTGPGAGKFILMGDSDVAISSNNGASWSRPTLPTVNPCSVGARGTDYAVISGQRVIVMAGSNGVVCTSLDDGNTWTSNLISTYLSSKPIWDGSEFKIYGGSSPRRVYRSTDGLNWTTSNTTPTNITFTTVVKTAKGKFVSMQGGSPHFYENQTFLTSNDGITWTPATSWVGSHAITNLVHGVVDAYPGCGM